MEAGRKARILRRFSAVPLRWWTSGRTQVRYPVSWRVRLPEIGADLVFSPLADDQEIPVLGVLRAVWEGAGTVSGHVAGRSVAGRARLELYGDGFLSIRIACGRKWQAASTGRSAIFYPGSSAEMRCEAFWMIRKNRRRFSVTPR